jgi:hypothetical protein
MEKFIQVKDATRQALKHSEQRSSSVDARQTTPRVRLNFFFQLIYFKTLVFVQSETDWSTHSGVLDPPIQNQLKQENAHLKIALAQR